MARFFAMFQKIKQYLEGSRRDPFLYLGLTAVILFGLLSVLSPSPGQVFSPIFLKALQEKERSFLVAGLNVRESPDLSFIQKNSLAAVSPPTTVTPQVLGALAAGADYEVAEREIVEYTVQEGDTLWDISEKFDISEDTIRWANDIQGSAIQPGQKLTILPVSGALHLIRSRDTLSEVALWYKAGMEDIMEFNEISSPEQIFAGDLLVIPNGVKPNTLPAARLSPIGDSYFISPIYPLRLTQGLHYYNAVDLSNGFCGESVYAAAGGTVQRTGYSPVGGKYVRILHPNGVVTYYGHFSGIIVSPGDRVLQGQTIGYTGYTGQTIPAGPGGCHVHFEARGARNPFAR